MTAKRWRLLPAPPSGFSRSLDMTPFHAQLLYNRGITSRSQVDSFLSADANLLNDPFLLPDMEQGVERVQRALRAGETIALFGDFDTDGVTGTALLAGCLETLGARVIAYLPHRVEEGHGLNMEAVRQLRAQSASLLITVDCGTTSVEEVAEAASLGMDTIITDHHSLPPALPSACAMINPRVPHSRYPFAELSGAGLAFKLAQGLYQHLGREWSRGLLELACLGTVADLAPLVEENRCIAREGLKVLNDTRRLGLQALLQAAGLRPGSIDTEALSFGLIPRLNAPGRLDHAATSLRLLTTRSPEEADLLARELEQRNTERQQLTREALAGAEEEVARQGALEPLLLVGEEGWSPGILGLVAGKLVEEFYRPAVALSLGGEVIRASARSIAEFNIVEALGTCRDLFIRFGGHARAAGFTMPAHNLPLLESRLKAVALEKLSGLDLSPTIDIDAQVSLGLLTGGTFRFLESLAPFGQGNPAPLFLTRNAQVVDMHPVGGHSEHLRLKLKQGSAVWNGIAFWQGDNQNLASDRIDLVYSVGTDSWGPEETLRLTVVDFRPAR